MLDLAHLSDAEFDALWRERIEPLMQAKEGDRLAAKAERNRRLKIGLPIAAGLGLLIFLIWRETDVMLAVAGVGALVAWGIAEQPMMRLARKVKEETLQTLAAAIGVTYRALANPGLTERYRALGLLPAANRESYDDWFHGERQGCSFDLYEGHMEVRTRTKNGETWSTVFRGQIIRLQFPRQFSGVTVVQRDAGMFNGLMGLGSQRERVGFADPDFERLFEVRSTDQVEARVLVHPVFAERLLELERQMRGSRLRCGFEGGDLLIAIETMDRYEIGGMGKTLLNPDRARSIVNDLAAILRLMDAVLTAEQATLARHNQARESGGEA